MATITDPVPTNKSDNTALPVNNSSFVDMSRFSSLAKLLRVTAYVLRFIDNCRGGRSTGSQETLTTEELHRAEKVCIRSCQMSIYQAEVKDIQTKRYELPLSRQLKLFLNSGILKCRGRIHNAPLDEMTKYPYLLPAKHPFTNLVIKDAQSRLLHAGVSSTITFLRQKYWILSIRQNVKVILRKCTCCKKIVGKPYSSPDPPPLPKSRVSDVKPFTYTGVDFTGALLVRDNNRKTTGRNDQTISVGDVVLVHDDVPRLLWKLAVVEELVPEKDGRIRSAKIRTQNGLTNRAIVKLYPLEVY